MDNKIQTDIQKRLEGQHHYNCCIVSRGKADNFSSKAYIDRSYEYDKTNTKPKYVSM